MDELSLREIWYRASNGIDFKQKKRYSMAF